MKIKVCYCVGLLLLLLSCGEKKQVVEKSEEAQTIRFGSLREDKLSYLISITRFLPLETTDNSLVGTIDQLEVVGDRIILLDGYTSNSLFVFSAKDGKMLARLSGEGNSPGEFLSPHSFWVEYSDSSLYVLDRISSKLIKYRLSDLAYIEEIKLPANSPLAFALLPDSAQFIYYYPFRSEKLFGGNQFIKADKEGNVLSTCYPAPPSGRILHGNPAAFYRHEYDLCMVPYFCDKVYRWDEDSLCVCYHLDWDNSKLPDDSYFSADDSAEIMKRFMSENYIRFLYVYENTASLAVKYYIKKELYLSAWNKKRNTLVNVKANDVVDDLGIGGQLPLPVGVSGTEELVGVLQPQTIDRTNVKEKSFVSILPSIEEEDNPILVFYTLK